MPLPLISSSYKSFNCWSIPPGCGRARISFPESKNLLHPVMICWSLSLFPEFFPQRCPQPLQNSHFNIQQNVLPLFLCGRHSTITHTHFVSHYGSKLSPRAQTKLQKNRSLRSKQHTPELTQLKRSSTVPTLVQATIISHLQIAIAR